MKETIYTIPINEAFETDCECPICEFIKKEEKNRVEYSLGASMMEPDERIRSNENGYCSVHTQMMYDLGNKLSHALVLETRLQYIEETIENLADFFRKNTQKKIFGKKKNEELALSKQFVHLQQTANSCVICQRLEQITERFINNLFYMYKKDDEFKAKFFGCKGFCIKHFEMLLSYGMKELAFEQYIDFATKLCKLQKDNISRVCSDVNWFTKKFDYRYKDADWKNSKDAVQRGCNKISGYIKE